MYMYRLFDTHIHVSMTKSMSVSTSFQLCRNVIVRTDTHICMCVSGYACIQINKKRMIRMTKDLKLQFSHVQSCADAL